MEGISLGLSCTSAILGVQKGIRKTKKNGYMTCPFDTMVSNYKGIIECIKDDFLYFCDPLYLELKLLKNAGPKYDQPEYLIYNNKYKFIFNHESPGHANLY